MGGDSTTIAGNAISPACVRHAGMLNLDIYDKTKADLPETLHPYLALNRQHWEVIWERKESDGFLARLYKPRGGENAEAVGTCPPVLVFRGSDSEPEDFAELAGALRISYTYSAETPVTDVQGSGVIDRSFGAVKALSGKTLKQMRAMGHMREETLFQNMVGSANVQVGEWEWSRSNLMLKWTVDASLFYGMAGDWAVNFAQGLGRFIPPPV